MEIARRLGVLVAACCQQSTALSMRCGGAYSMGYCYASGCARVAGTLERVSDCGGFPEHCISINYSS